MFDEDREANARLCLELAPKWCNLCENFHLGSIMRRRMLSPHKKTADGAEFKSALALVLDALQNQPQPVRVLICGATDTGLYATLLQAAKMVGGLAYCQSLEITLLDRCRTPLEICSRFAAAHWLELHTVQAGLEDYQPPAPLDLVIMHGVLTFVPVGQRQETLARISRWLTGRGRMVSSTQMGAQSAASALAARTGEALAGLHQTLQETGTSDRAFAKRLETMVVSGMTARDRHDNPFCGHEEALSFYQSAGLTVQSFWIVENNRAGDGQSARRHSRRGIAICSGNG